MYGGVSRGPSKSRRPSTAGGGFQSDKFKVANLKATASDLDVDISAAKSKAEIAAAIHSSLTSSLGEGASFKYVLKEMGKSVGDEHAEFWDKAAAEVAEAKGGAPAAMDVVAGNT